MKKLLIAFSLFSVFSCSKPQPKQEITSCITDSLIGRQFLDSSYLMAVKKITPNRDLAESNDGMVKITGGVFDMGGDLPDGFENMPKSALAQADEFPKHRVQVSDFYMDENEVTIGDFNTFVEATNYKTVAEYDVDWEMLKKQLPEGTPKPDENLLKAGSLVFHYVPEPLNSTENPGNWWTFTTGINWRNPDGQNRKLQDIQDWPVTQISWYDAIAYAKWTGKRLPTEAEFEYAMRGGKSNKMYPWGNQKLSENLGLGNFLQGDFPYTNTGEDGFDNIAPVKQFPPNAYGLYDMSGNVWEWTADWYSPLYYTQLAEQDIIAVNPQGPEQSKEVYDPRAINKSVRGGSFLCHDSWCSGYRNSRRMRLSPDTGMQHIGFRLVKDVN